MKKLLTILFALAVVFGGAVLADQGQKLAGDEEAPIGGSSADIEE